MAERVYLGHLDVDGRTILKFICKLEWKGVDWIAVSVGTGSASCCEKGDEMCGFFKMHSNTS